MSYITYRIYRYRYLIKAKIINYCVIVETLHRIQRGRVKTYEFSNI